MTRMKKPAVSVVLCLAFWTVGASLSLAQIKSGTITGGVTDKTGAVVPGAQITVTNEDTQVGLKFVTGAAGEYVSPYMEPGRYTVTVEHPGFSLYKQTGVVLTAGQTVEVDAQLQIGSTATTVEVQAQGLSLQTESTSVQGSVNDVIIENVPDLNHNPFYLATLMPGIQASNEQLSTQNAYSFGVGMYSRDYLSAFRVNGGQALESDITVDGISVMGEQENEAVVMPNKDGIEEVKAITNSFSAEYGRGNGAIEIITKSGTNQYHGLLFDQFRNEALNANTFGNNMTGVPKPSFKVDYFGGTIGGPIKKDKLFFFTSFEGLTHHTSAQWLATLPTALERVGNFSQTLVNYSGVATPVVLYDPFNATLKSSNLYLHNVIPNATIPNPNTYAKALYGAYPLPNRTPTDVYNSNNYFTQGVQTTRKDDVNARIDFYHGRHSIYGTGGIHDGQIVTPYPWGANNPYYYRPTSVGGVSLSLAPYVGDHNPYVGIGDTITIGPTVVADLRLGLQRVSEWFYTQLDPNFDYNALGIPPSIQAVFVLPGSPPNLSTSRWTSLNSTNSDHKHTYETNWHIAASLTEVRGKWTFKQGGEDRIQEFADPNIYEGSVGFNSSANFTAQYTDAFGNTTAQDTTVLQDGFYDAGLLAGAGDLVISPGESVKPEFCDKYYAFYSQNDWRATPRLTVNLGLRWEVQPAASERYNRISSVDTTVNNIWGVPGVIAFAGVGSANGGNYNRNLWNTTYGDIGPRVGAAYKITDTMVVRGGWGLIYTPTNTGFLHGPFDFGASPFSITLNDVPYGTTPAGVPIGSFDDPAISVPVNEPGADPTNPSNYDVSGENLMRKSGYQDGRVQQWNVFVEKRFKGGWILSGGYVGTHGVHLPVSRVPMDNIYELGPTYWTCYRTGVNCTATDSDLSASGGYINTGHDPENDAVSNPWNPTGTLKFQTPLNATTIPRYLRESKYPMFVGMTQAETYGFSNYKGLQVQVRHSSRYGLTLNASYSYTRARDFTQAEIASETSSGTGFTAGLTNYQDLRKNYHLSWDDIPSRGVISAVYELPWGPGKYFNVDNRALRAIVGGWKLGGVAMLQSGFPTAIGGASAGAMNSLPNRVPGEPFKVPKSLQHWYDGKTTVTLPDGRQVTPCANCYLLYNVDAFAGQAIPSPTKPGTFITDNYWMGDAALTYNDIRSPDRVNLDLTLARDFKLTERFSLEFTAMATNALNHTELGGSISSSDIYNSNALGGTNVTPPSAANNNTQIGQGAGSATYGTLPVTTFDPRQIELGLRVRF